ncbi:MAG: hypothetical protein ACNA7M_08265 [Roseovarius sp.]
MTTIVTPKPPLNLFEVVRSVVPDVWDILYEAPRYRVPPNGPNPERFVDTAAIMTGLVLAKSGAGITEVSVRVVQPGGAAFLIVDKAQVFPNDFLLLKLDRQVLKTGETLQLRCEAGQTCDAHLTFILNTREEFEVIA